MFAHYKRLQYMVRAADSIPELANLMLEQFGGPQGKLAAACRYFTQALGEDDPAHAQMTQTGMAATKTMALRASSDPGLDYLAGAEVGAGGTEPTSAAAPRRYRRQGPCHQYIDISRRSVTVPCYRATCYVWQLGEVRQRTGQALVKNMAMLNPSTRHQQKDFQRE